MTGFLREFRGHRLLGILLSVLGVVLSLIGIAFFRLLLDGNEPKWIILFVLFASLSFALSSLSLRYGGKLRGLASLETLVKDTRPPVIYLRPFDDDPITAKELDGPLSLLAKTEEKVLADALSRIGPCFSIAKPITKELEEPQPGWKRFLKSKLLEKPPPKVGMMRVDLEDAGQDWLTPVENMIKQAGAVVIRVGDTKGIWSEIEAAVKYVEPERLLFLLPFETDAGRSNHLGLGQISPYGYETFRQRIEKHIPCQLPPLRAPRLRGSTCSFFGVLFFESDWTPHVIPVESTGINVSDRTPLKKSLEPFLARFKKDNYH